MELRRSLFVLILAVLVVVTLTGCPPAKENPAPNDQGGQTQAGSDDNGAAVEEPATVPDEPAAANGSEEMTEEPMENGEESMEEPMEEPGEEAMEEPDDEGEEGEMDDDDDSGDDGGYIGANADPVGSDACLMCHSDKGPGDGASHVSLFEGEGGMFVGTGCEKCHGPGGNHNGNPAGILDPEDMPLDDVIALCSMCHANKGKFELEAYRASKHYAAGNSCVLCHDPHAENDHFLAQPAVNDICGNCHSDKVAGLADGSHGVADADCTMCHNPHADM